MVAQVFLLLLVVAVEYTIVLGNYRDIHYIRGCIDDCDEICSQPCVDRNGIVVDEGWIMPHGRRNDICVARNCSNTCIIRCAERNNRYRYDTNNGLGLDIDLENNRNSKQGKAVSWSSNSSSRTDICLENCNKECHENCIQLCATRIIGRLGEILLYRNDICVEKCDKDCSSACTQKCVTRNSKQPPPRGSRKNPCEDNFIEECEDSCLQQCNYDGDDWIAIPRILGRDACVDKCVKECVYINSSAQGCGSKRSNRKTWLRF